MKNEIKSVIVSKSGSETLVKLLNERKNNTIYKSFTICYNLVNILSRMVIVMEKVSKITAVLLALALVLSLFAACGKDDNKEEESTTDGFTLQVNNGEAENTEEYTTSAQSTTEVTTKEEQTTKLKEPVNVVNTTAKAKDKTTVAPTTKSNENGKANEDYLIGVWETTVDSEGLPVTIQFKFEPDGVVKVDFTRAAYDDMVKKAVETELSKLTDEEIAEAGFSDRKEAEEYLYECFEQEAPYDELRDTIENTGSWSIERELMVVKIDKAAFIGEFRIPKNKTSLVLCWTDVPSNTTVTLKLTKK